MYIIDDNDGVVEREKYRWMGWVRQRRGKDAYHILYMPNESLEQAMFLHNLVNHYEVTFFRAREIPFSIDMR